MVSVDGVRCAYCGSCVSVCPVGALDLQETRLLVSPDCIECNLCVSACPMGALAPPGPKNAPPQAVSPSRSTFVASDERRRARGPNGEVWYAVPRSVRGGTGGEIERPASGRAGLVPAGEKPLAMPALKDRYDVVVVGAGPAGSVAAWEAATQGLDVLLLEKRQEIGSPVRCAEGITRQALESVMHFQARA